MKMKNYKAYLKSVKKRKKNTKNYIKINKD